MSNILRLGEIAAAGIGRGHTKDTSQGHTGDADVTFVHRVGGGVIGEGAHRHYAVAADGKGGVVLFGLGIFNWHVSLPIRSKVNKKTGVLMSFNRRTPTPPLRGNYSINSLLHANACLSSHRTHCLQLHR